MRLIDSSSEALRLKLGESEKVTVSETFLFLVFVGGGVLVRLKVIEMD